MTDKVSGQFKAGSEQTYSNCTPAEEPVPLVKIETSESFEPKSSSNTNLGHQYAGRHFIVDFWGAALLDDVAGIELALRDAAEAGGAHLLHIHLHKFSEGGGVTGVALLAESHISIHSWPEHGYAAFDVFMCGASHPERAVEVLKSTFNPTRVEIKEILRGKLGPREKQIVPL